MSHQNSDSVNRSAFPWTSYE